MRRLLFLAVALALCVPLYASTCPAYTCEAMFVPLASGGYALMGQTVVPTTWYPSRPDAANVYVIYNGQTIQTIPLWWSTRNYFCCCPSDWLGEFADVAQIDAPPGERVLVVFGEKNLCEREVVIPAHPKPLVTDSATNDQGLQPTTDTDL